MPEFAFTEILPLGKDDTPYRLVTTDGVSTFDTPEGRFLKVSPAALTRITEEAMRDIAHFLRPGHLQQLHCLLHISKQLPANSASKTRPATSSKARQSSRPLKLKSTSLT